MAIFFITNVIFSTARFTCILKTHENQQTDQPTETQTDWPTNLIDKLTPKYPLRVCFQIIITLILTLVYKNSLLEPMTFSWKLCESISRYMYLHKFFIPDSDVQCIPMTSLKANCKLGLLYLNKEEWSYNFL